MQLKSSHLLNIFIVLFLVTITVFGIANSVINYSVLNALSSKSVAGLESAIVTCVNSWTETRPAGDVDRFWGPISSSHDGTHLVALSYGNNNKIYMSSDSGKTWTENHPTPNDSPNWSVVASSSYGNTIIVGGTQVGGRLYISSDFGKTWTETKPINVKDTDFLQWSTVAISPDGSHLIAGYRGAQIGSEPYVSGGRLYLSSDFGKTWTETRPAGNHYKNWKVVSFSDGPAVIAGVNGGRLYISYNYGVTWAETRPAGDFNYSWQTASFSQNGQRIIAGASQTRPHIAQLSSNGFVWHITLPAGNHLSDWQSVSSNYDGTKLIAAVNGGRLYTSSNSGTSWAETQPAGNVDKSWTASYSSDGSHIIAGAYNGRLYIYSCK